MRTKSMRRLIRGAFLVGAVIATSVIGTLPVRSQQRTSTPSVATQPGEWRYLNGDTLSTRYSPLDQINKDNIKSLKIAWRWRSEQRPRPATPTPSRPAGAAADNGDAGGSNYNSESTPLMVNGVMYITAGMTRTVSAIDPVSGRTLWTWNGIDEGVRALKAPRRNPGRGVGYWTDGKEERLYVVTTGFFLVALNAKTGVPVPTFGVNGVVDLMAELHVPFDHVGHVGNSSPPMVYQDTVIVPPAGEEGFVPMSMRNTPLYVMAFDARTGKQKWVFHTVPKTGEFGADTWEGDSNTYTGNTGVWAPISVDPELGYAYLPVETPTDDYYGGHRLGNDLFGNTLVCVDLATGKRVWHFQITHHDVWNYDLPEAPILADIPMNGTSVKAVVQLTKQAYAYVFNRVTGQPIWPIVERPVPQSDVPGERTSLTQPIPSKPDAYDRQGYNEGDLVDFTPALRAEAIKVAQQYRLGPVFTPPSQVMPNGTKGTWYTPGGTGGSLWQSGAFDPETGILYVPSQTQPGIIAVANDSKSDLKFSRSPSSGRVTVAGGIPILKPPYSRITAIDLKTGDHLWAVAAGETPAYIKNNPALKGLTIPKTGIITHPLILLTKTLLIGSEGSDLYAYDKTTGAVLWQTNIPGTMEDMPMTYMVDGKQYIAFTMGDQARGSELVAFTLGDSATEGSPNR